MKRKLKFLEHKVALNVVILFMPYYKNNKYKKTPLFQAGFNNNKNTK